MYSIYPSDPRPRRAAEALAKEGVAVEVICLRENDQEPLRESFNGVEITRLPIQRRRGGKISYVVQYGIFVLVAGLVLAGRALKRRYDLVHIHNMPDVLVFSSLVPKLLGAKVILDLHDPMPELMTAIFGFQEKSHPVLLLKILEKWSIRFADAVITVNECCRKIFSSRSCSLEKVSVVMNSPDEKIFGYRQPSKEASLVRDPSKPFVIMYHGSLVERHGLDLAVSALEKLGDSVPQIELRVYGWSTPFLEEVMASVQKSKIVYAIRYMGPKNLEEIAEAVRQCDLGVIPNRRSVFTELNTPTRIFEYLSQGKPVVAPRAPGIVDYFDSHEPTLFELGDADDLAAKLEFAFYHPAEMTDSVKRGQAVYLEHRWTTERSRFVELVENLLQRKSFRSLNADGRPESVHLSRQ
jgi:glycosyltransferase involved in cell wall biosynthesis